MTFATVATGAFSKLEIEAAAGTALVPLDPGGAGRRGAVAKINRWPRGISRRDSGVPDIGRLARQQIQRADLVDDILPARIVGVAFDRLIGRQNAGGQQEGRQKYSERSSRP